MGISHRECTETITDEWTEKFEQVRDKAVSAADLWPGDAEVQRRLGVVNRLIGEIEQGVAAMHFAVRATADLMRDLELEEVKVVVEERRAQAEWKEKYDGRK